MSELHAMLKAKTIKSSNGNVINLYDRMVQIKEKATIWLSKLEKNGYEHSERLEEYLDEITKKPRLKGKLFPEEAFILLCAVYMHDLGYWLDGKCVAKGHPERSREMILENPGEYLLDDFPCMSIDNPPRVAEAIGWVCKGHSEERYFSLNEVPYDFADKALSNDTLNLRKLSALLRIADEADDPYIRLVGESYHPIRAKTPLVQIGDETIAWHWKYASGTTSDTFLQHIREKQEILVSSIDYLAEKEFGYWYLVLYPQVEGSSTYMPEEPVETFVGREEDLNKLHFIVQKRRQGAVSGVVGIGGIGKTELAKMYARRYRNEYPGGVFWASLKGSDWKSQAMKILKHLRPGVEPTGLPDEAKAKEVIKKVLGRKGALLIIDNVTKADQIIQPGCYLLITSREKDVFGIIPHEAIHILPGLSIDEGKDLLKKILGEERVQNDLLGAERLIKILGGMPLAVEIAAKHLADAPGVSFPEYIRWVDRKIEKLKLDDIFEKDVVASFEISLEQLHNERGGDKLIDLFEAVSVCAPSGFTSKTLAAAAGLNDLDEMTAGQYMGKLHNRSLLEYNEKTFSFSVHPLLFQIAERRLRENKSRHKSFMRNHCEYFLTYAEVNNTDIGMLIVEMYGLSCAMIQATYLDQSGRMLQRFIENISKTYWDLISKGAYGEALVYLEIVNLIDSIIQPKQIIELLEPLILEKDVFRETYQSWLLGRIGQAYNDLGEYRKAIGFYEQAIEIDREIGDIDGETIHLKKMGTAYHNLCEYSMALDLYDQALKYCHRKNNISAEGYILCCMGLTYYELGEFPKALDLYEKALEIDHRTGDIDGEGATLVNMGLIYIELGQFKKALSFYEQALEIDRRTGNISGEGITLGNIGMAYTYLDEHQKAISFYEQAIDIDHSLGHIREECYALGNMGLSYVTLGEYRKAFDLFGQQLEIAQKIGDIRAEAGALGNMGDAYHHHGEYRKAIGFYEQAIEIDRKVGNIQGLGIKLGNMSGSYTALGENRKAIDLAKQALKINRMIGDIRAEAYALSGMGAAYANLGEKEKARETFIISIELFKKIGLDHMVQYVTKMMESVNWTEEKEKPRRSFIQLIEILRKIGLNYLVQKIKNIIQSFKRS